MYYHEFKKIGIEAPYKTGGTGRAVCPKCSERKGGGVRDRDLSLNFDSGAYKCHSGNCGWSGYVRGQTFSRPEWKNRTDLPAGVVKYFEGRGISQRTLRHFRVSTDGHGNVQFNYFRGEVLVNIKTRFEKNGRKGFRQHPGAEKVLFNVDCLQSAKKVVVVEGEMDVLSWFEAGLPKGFGVVSVDQGAPSPGQRADGKLECLTNCANELDGVEAFYLCTDKDAPGVYLQQELIRRLGDYRCFVVDLPEGKKDANEVLDRRGGNPIAHEANRECLRRCLAEAKPVPVPGVYLLDGEVSDRMDHYFTHGRPRGATTHFPVLDGVFSFLRGDMTLVTGLPNDGKSQFLRQLAVVKAKIDGWKWACYVPEDFPVDFFFDDLVHTFIGKHTDRRFVNQMSPAEYNEAKAFVGEHFFCIYPEPNERGEVPLPTNDWINERVRFLKLKFGVNAYMKDPWNKIYHDFLTREDRYLASELSKEKFFAAQFDAALYVAHPAKVMKGKDGRYPCPDVYDISGGAMWNNMMDNILVVYRPNRYEDARDTMVKIHSKKIKKQKLVGRLGSEYLWYDAGANRYFQWGNDFNPLQSVPPLPRVEDGEFDDLPF